MQNSITSVEVKVVVRGGRRMYRLLYTIFNGEFTSNHQADFFDLGDPIVFDEAAYKQF